MGLVLKKKYAKKGNINRQQCNSFISWLYVPLLFFFLFCFRLMEEKEEYQELAKGTLKKLVDEKLQAVKKLKEVEKALSTSEDEFAALKEVYDRDSELAKKLAEDLNTMAADMEELKKKVPPEEDKKDDEVEEGATKKEEEGEEGAAKEAEERENTEEGKKEEEGGGEKGEEEAAASEAQEVQKEASEVSEEPESQTTSSPSSEEPDGATASTSEASSARLHELESQLTLRGDELESVRARCGSLQEDNDRLRAEVESLQAARAETESLDSVKTLEGGGGEREKEEEEEEEERERRQQQQQQKEEVSRLEALVESLRADLEASQSKQSGLRRQLEEARQEKQEQEVSVLESPPLHNSTGLLDDSVTDHLNASLQEAEEKITQLLKVKERYAEMSASKATLERSLVKLEREVATLGAQSQAATACAVVPVAVLVIAFIVAYLPTIAAFFGTSDDVQ